ncbi:MAG: Nudix family hydrolase [Ketobacter sp.]|nr:Nudix family hydrolase [Ketobacter sp.]
MKRVHVVAAVITNGDEILIARRPDHLHQGGKWEFPGGKVESGEPVSEALARELNEELGIIVGASEPLITIDHEYPDKHVLLDVWKVTDFTGDAKGMEGQEVRWVTQDSLARFEFPAANVPIVAAARLPQCYVITPDCQIKSPADLDAFVQKMKAMMVSGQRLFQLRLKQLDAAPLSELVGRLVELKAGFNATVLVNSDMPNEVQQAFDGVHLTSAALHQLVERPAGHDWVAASCHSLEELRLAEQCNVDFVTLSPFRHTASHPNAEPIGETRFAEWAFGAKMPVYALGGVGAQDIKLAASLGAQGVAGIRAFWPGGCEET